MKRFFQSEVTHGITGTSIAVGGLTLSSYLNAWLQTISLAVSIVVGIATLISLIRKLRNKP